MKLLIIEDNLNKLKNIREFVKKTYAGADIHDALSYTAGLRRIYDQEWDVILLDMSLPIYDMSEQETGGDKKSIAGKEIMKRMVYRDILIPTIVITQFDTFGEREISIHTLNEEFKETLSEVWRGTINYEDSTNKWMSELKILLDKITEEQADDQDFDC
ncbi:MAG: hypothetical protein IJ711_13020 [Lachnospiraceae bacterium]|nr:hypothetical protein [Lachnospiraceae bacterium]